MKINKKLIFIVGSIFIILVMIKHFFWSDSFTLPGYDLVENQRSANEDVVSKIINEGSNQNSIDNLIDEINAASIEERRELYRQLGAMQLGFKVSQIHEILRTGLVSNDAEIKLNTINFLAFSTGLDSDQVIDFFNQNQDIKENSELELLSDNGDERLSGYMLTNIGNSQSDEQATTLLLNTLVKEEGEYERLEMFRGLNNRLISGRDLIEPVLVDEIVNGFDSFRQPIEAALLIKKLDNPPKEVVLPIINLIESECCYFSLSLLNVLSIYGDELRLHKDYFLGLKNQLQSNSIDNSKQKLQIVNNLLNKIDSLD